ncbi:MAG: hypothetical protein J5I91_08940 [Bacteroidetes bacterium]|nr:hypothetical protein [Bacteroidota bacterium]
MHPEIEIKLRKQSYIEAEMIESAFNFWFSDNQHLRSPFPFYIREQLQFEASKKFIDWAAILTEKAKKEINDDILAEKLEEIIFETALQMVLTEDEKITIRYPFMPRKGDHLNQKNNENVEKTSIVTDRIYYKKGDEAFLKVKLKDTTGNNEWETEFELPE